MISVLIPVFNYNIVPLVCQLHTQLTKTGIAFEILALDNGSDARLLEINKNSIDLSFTTYSISQFNLGREQTRQKLSQDSRYNWLLFLDADTLPSSSDFIETYLSYLSSDVDAVFGGIDYHPQPPETDYMLRWKYGMARETINCQIRSKRPYRAIVSANFMIRKSIFMALNEQITSHDYGNDILFAGLLKSNLIRLMHIDNPVYHLGIEKSDAYLIKNEEAASTYLSLANKGSISFKDNRLLTYFSMLKRCGLNYPTSMLFNYFKPLLRRNLLGPNPNIALLQLYKLSYMCSIDLKTTH